MYCTQNAGVRACEETLPEWDTLSSRQHRDVTHWILKQSTVPDDEIPSSAVLLCADSKSNTLEMAAVYKVGDYVILQDSEVDSREWVMQVTEFLVFGAVGGKYHSFC